MTLAIPPAPRTAVNLIPPQPAHILIVDDEPEIAESLSDFLAHKENFRISLAGDGEEAIEFLKATVASDVPEVDLVILDMRMPHVSGLDVLNWIRSNEVLRFLRVVLLTAATSSHEKVVALTAGADDYITKPYRPQELLARVKTILRTLNLEKQLQQQCQLLAKLNQIGQRVASTLQVREVLQTAVDGLAELLQVQVGAALLLERGMLRYRGFWDAQGTAVESLPPLAKDTTILGKIFTTQEGLMLNDLQSDLRFDPTVDAPPGYAVRSMIAVPLVVRGNAVGVMCGYNKKKGDFTEFDMAIFTSLASSVSEAVQNAWLFSKNAERQRELLENRNTLQALIDGIPHPIYTINDVWQLVGVNQSKADEMAANAHELVGQVCYEVFFDRHSPCEHCRVAATLAGKTAQRWVINYMGDDALPREWDVNAYPIPSEKASSARAVILWQDRTDERRLENSLLQAGKLAAIGQLAAGVAHEINNPLTAINANAEMLMMEIPEEDDKYEAVDLISRAGARATHVVRGLLDFARQEHYNFAPNEINVSVYEALELVTYQLQSTNIDVITDLAPDLPIVVGSWEHLKSVWLNLLVNARDALQEVEHNRELEIATRLGSETEHVQVIIRDNGKGMSAAQAAHIFEPFYTTKDPGKGTGLGLATSHRIIEQHHGEINVVTAPGEGTTFIIRLPLHPPRTPQFS